MGETMTRTNRSIHAAVVMLSMAVLPSGPPLAAAPGPQSAATPADTESVAEFRKRCAAYVELHKKVEAGLPKLPQDATPEQIDHGQQLLSKGIVSARAAARPGDVFSPDFVAYLRQALAAVFKRPDGKQLRSSILDENPVDATVRINGPYPDEIALSTMPPQLLAALPKLPDELEYRFIGERLILFDHHAHIIVDYIDRALPRV
jgi:hypothetical protein